MADAPGRDEGYLISQKAFWTTGAILACLFAISVYAVIPKNVLSNTLTEGLRPTINSLWPQGWGFFTKDPDSATFDVYSVGPNDVIESLLTTPQGLPENLLGLSRASRAQGPEIALLHSMLEEKVWVECDGPSESCLSAAAAAEPLVISNGSPQATICGGVVLSREKPTPWAYRALVAEDFKITHTVRVDVRCGGEP